MRRITAQLRLYAILLLLLTLLCGCAAQKAIVKGSLSEASRETASQTEASTEAPRCLQNAVLTQSAAAFASYDAPTADIVLTLSGVTPKEDGLPCTLRVFHADGTLSFSTARTLTGSTEEFRFSVPYAFSRYMEQTSDTLTAELSCADEQLTCEIVVGLQNAPDEVYAAASGVQHPYSIEVLRNQNVVLIYGLDEDGSYSHLVKAFVCSVGRYNATPTGSYSLSGRYPWRALFGGVYGQYAVSICGDILFHSVPYSTAQKDTLHYEDYNLLGEAASMGCIRLSVADAKWIFDFCPAGTPVHIYDSDTLPVEKPEPIHIAEDSPYRGWDPTDPDPENPWR